MDKSNTIIGGVRKIWLAGGCFWGVQEYFSRIPGVTATSVGYANGKTPDPTYYEIGKTGHSETVQVSYDTRQVSLRFILAQYFKIVDPTVMNRQGNDVGTQYRTGIYYEDEDDLELIQSIVAIEQKKYKGPILTEILPLDGFYPAEEYHQDYLKKNPHGYCHIDFSKLEDPAAHPFVDPSFYIKPEDDSLKKVLSDMEYKVTQENVTEPPFDNTYWDHYDRGVYVDITSGEPLFVSSDKFESGCGWPSFSRPLDPDVIKEKTDTTHGMLRIEVRSRVGDAHLGHVFNDGPKESGGLRYCINSAALKFIPVEEMEASGYGWAIPLVK